MQLEIQQFPVDRLIPYARNARTHSDAQVAQIAGSIAEFGFVNPILIGEDGVIVAGHGRLLAAQRLGMKDVPVIVLGHLTETQRRALVIADNRIALNAGWDEEMLKLELTDLDGLDFNMDLLGFSDDELDAMLDGGEGETEGLTEEDAVPEIEEKAISKIGDLWILGNHRLLCGDSTDEESVRRLFEGQKAHLFSTDPPYLVDYTGADRPGGFGKDWSDKYNEVDIKDAEGFFTAVFGVAKKLLKIDAAWYCWHAHKRAALIEQVWEKLEVLNHQQIIWVKPAALHSYSYYPWRHEPCLMGWQKGHKPKHDGNNGHAITSVWELDWEGKARAGKTEHPTQKPVEIFAIPMRKHTKEGEICYEPFSGSGSQIIAGEKCHRRVFAMEISPPFVDAAIRRWEKYTGKQAVLEETGNTFADTERDRQEAQPHDKQNPAALESPQGS